VPFRERSSICAGKMRPTRSMRYLVIPVSVYDMIENACGKVCILQQCISAVVLAYWCEHGCTGAGDASSNCARSHKFFFFYRSGYGTVKTVL